MNPAAGTAGTKGGERPWWILAVVVAAELMVVLDGTVMNIALPSVQRTLDMSDTDRQWVPGVYSLAFGGLLLVGGRVWLTVSAIAGSSVSHSPDSRWPPRWVGRHRTPECSSQHGHSKASSRR